MRKGFESIVIVSGYIIIAIGLLLLGAWSLYHKNQGLYSEITAEDINEINDDLMVANMLRSPAGSRTLRDVIVEKFQTQSIADGEIESSLSQILDLAFGQEICFTFSITESERIFEWGSECLENYGVCQDRYSTGPESQFDEANFDEGDPTNTDKCPEQFPLCDIKITGNRFFWFRPTRNILEYADCTPGDQRCTDISGQMALVCMPSGYYAGKVCEGTCEQQGDRVYCTDDMEGSEIDYFDTMLYDHIEEQQVSNLENRMQPIDIEDRTIILEHETDCMPGERVHLDVDGSTLIPVDSDGIYPIIVRVQI